MTFKEVIDDLRVERFERLVQKQKPASEPWTPVTDYSFEARKAIEGRHPELIRDVFQPMNALDVGCGSQAILVRLMCKLGMVASGMDTQPSDAPHTFVADIADRYHGLIGGVHDLVICREVLEHLTVRHVAVAVRNLVYLSSRYVYVTTRFAKNPTHLLDVDTSDDLDPTHITMLTKPFLRTLFVLEGCKSRPDLEAKMDWQGKGRCLVFEVV